jgi:prophage antirepressor-like protein
MSNLELKTIEPLPIGQNIFENIGFGIEDAFRDIRIYGTIEEPLFVAVDIQALLDLKDMRIARNEHYVEGVDWCRILVRTTGGKRTEQEAIALTESGLYLALFRSNTETAKQFRRFVIVLLKRLRMQGSVSAEEATTDFELIEKNERLEDLLDLEKARVERLRNRLDAREDPDVEDLKEKLLILKKMYMKPLVISLVQPAEHLQDVHEYTLDEFVNWDSDICRDDVYIWTVSKSVTSLARPITTLYIHTNSTVEMVLEFLKTKKIGVKNSKGEYYDSKFETSLEILEDLVETFNRERCCGVEGRR